MRYGLLLLILILGNTGFAQNVGIGTSNPHPSAVLELQDNARGFLPPRLTTSQRDSIINPAPGLQIYNLTTDCLEIYGRGKWNAIYCIPIDSTLITDIDGNTYPTVKICEQTWMAKNLDVTRYRNGDIIPQVTDPTQWANLTTGAWCWYNNDSATYGSVYGKLYNWYAVNDPRGLAPTGWHVPNEKEWNVLAKCLDINADTICQNCYQSTFGGGAMKSLLFWESPNFGATNSSGFSGLPGGSANTSFNSINKYGSWWSLNEVDSINSWSRTLEHNQATLYKDPNPKSWCLSIRCLKDLPPPATLDSGLVAYYPFNENANDESGNGNNLNSFGNPNYSSSNHGYACNFPNGNDYFTTPQSSWSLINNFPKGTVSFWLKIDSQFTSGHYFGLGNTFMIKQKHSVGEDLFFGMQDGTTKIRMQITGIFPSGSESNVIGNTSLIPNLWYHIAGVWNGSTHSLYVNGILDGQINNSNGISNRPLPDYFAIGSCLYGNYGTTTYPTGAYGAMDEVRIYNRALTQTEITYLATH